MTSNGFLPRGWAHRSVGFYHNEIRTRCQIYVPNRGLFTHECGKHAHYARTFWNGSVGFCCVKHKPSMERLSSVVLERFSVNNEVVVMRPHYTGPFYVVVDGAARPSEHPIHWDLVGLGRCWCGATIKDGAWSNDGLPLDTPDIYYTPTV